MIYRHNIFTGAHSWYTALIAARGTVNVGYYVYVRYMPDIDPVGRGTIVQRSKRIPVRNIAYKYVCQDRSFAAVVSNTRKINRFLDPFGYLGMYPINNFPLGLFRSADVVGRSYHIHIRTAPILLPGTGDIP